MPRYPKKSTLFSTQPTQQTFPCPVEGCRTRVRSRWGFTQHLRANHPGMDIQYPLAENEGNSVEVPSSDIDQTSSESPPPSPNTFSQLEDEPDTGNHARFSDWGPADFDLDGNTEPVPADLDPSEHDLKDEESVPAASIEFHPLINGMYINYVILTIFEQIIVGAPCDNNGNPLVVGSEAPITEMKDRTDWTPFNNRLEFETAEFLFKRCKMSAANIDILCTLWAASLDDFDADPPFSGHCDLYRSIDTIPVGGVPWQSAAFVYDGPRPGPDTGSVEIPKWMEKEYEIWFRDPRLLFKNMLTNRDFHGSFDYAPFRQYDDKGNRRYEHLMSGDWAWKQAVSTHLPFVGVRSG